MYLVRGGTDVMTIQQQLEHLRNSNVDLRDWHLGDGARRMSITNAIDILRRHVLKAIKKKKNRHLVNLIFDHLTYMLIWYKALNFSFVRWTMLRLFGQSLDWQFLDNGLL